MFEKYRLEISIGLTIAFMWLYPPKYGVCVALIAATAWLAQKWIARHESPDVSLVKEQVKELKAHVEKILLRAK